MSSRELNRVEVMGASGSGYLKLNDAAGMLGLSCRQTKRKIVVAVSAGGQPRIETWQSRTALESPQAAATVAPSFAFGSGKILRFGGGCVRFSVRRRSRVQIIPGEQRYDGMKPS
jgi:hypothetical protein